MKQKISTRSIVAVGVFAAVIAVLSQISVPMPSQVPITLQTFAIALAGYVLGWKRGLGAVGVYVLLGAVEMCIRDRRSRACENHRHLKIQQQSSRTGLRTYRSDLHRDLKDDGNPEYRSYRWGTETSGLRKEDGRGEERKLQRLPGD